MEIDFNGMKHASCGDEKQLTTYHTRKYITD